MTKDWQTEMREYYNVKNNNKERIRLIKKVNENHKREENVIGN